MIRPASLLLCLTILTAAEPYADLRQLAVDPATADTLALIERAAADENATRRRLAADQ